MSRPAQSTNVSNILYEGRYVTLKEVTSEYFELYFELIKKKKFVFYRPGLEELFASEKDVYDFLRFRELLRPSVEIEAFVFKKDNICFPIGIVGILGIDTFHRKAEISFVLWTASLKVFFETIIIALKGCFLGLKLEKVFFLVNEKNKKFLDFLKKRNILLEGILKKEGFDPLTKKRYNMFRFAVFPDILSHPTFLRLERLFL